MRFLSNLFSREREPDAPLEYGLVPADRLQQAVAQLLSYPGHVPDGRQITGFMESMRARGMDLCRTRIATRGSSVVYAICPVPLPGKIVMLLSGTPATQAQREAADVLLQQVLAEYLSSDNALLQVLVDPEDTAQMALYRAAGFSELASLSYLECPAQHMGYRLPEGGWELVTYAPERHQFFAEAIRASYEETLDCPQLNGLRSIEDVIAGHKAAGEFDPRNWIAVVRDSHPAGVLILSRVPASDALELTYIGLARFARGQGLASALMKLAIARAAELSCARLTTAVDTGNTPAITMYVRAGMRRIGTRVALIRVIHKRGVESSTIDPQSPK